MNHPLSALHGTQIVILHYFLSDYMSEIETEKKMNLFNRIK